MTVETSSHTLELSELLASLPASPEVFALSGATGSNLVAQGEGDFRVFDPDHGVLVIGVKSGGIRVEAGQWDQRNLATRVEYRMQDPVAQADRSRCSGSGSRAATRRAGVLSRVSRGLFSKLEETRNALRDLGLVEQLTVTE